LRLIFSAFFGAVHFLRRRPIKPHGAFATKADHAAPDQNIRASLLEQVARVCFNYLPRRLLWIDDAVDPYNLDACKFSLVLQLVEQQALVLKMCLAMSSQFHQIMPPATERASKTAAGSLKRRRIRPKLAFHPASQSIGCSRGPFSSLPAILPPEASPQPAVFGIQIQKVILLMLLSFGNLFDGADGDVSQEIVTKLVDTPTFKIERIVSLGQKSRFWYDQPWAEWVLVLAGSAGLRFEGETEVRVMSAGDFVLIPARKKHRVEWTAKNQPTTWLAVHFPETG
jgi:cupin 2 domain-containing protein